MKNPAYLLINKVVRMRQRLVNTNANQRNKAAMLKYISQFKRYAGYWKNKPEALKKYLATHQAEFFQLIPPTPQGDSLKNQFTQIVTL